MMDIKTNFLKAVRAFRDWADDFPHPKSAEWECDYGHWHEIEDTFGQFLDSAEPETWDGPLTDAVLYILARNNEPGVLKDELVERPRHLSVLAKVGQISGERDARWQLIEAVGRADFDLITAERLIKPYLTDSDEYVRRLALIALGEKKLPIAEAAAIRAWDTNHEYQRIAALHTLAAVGSPHLAHYLELAGQDGREALVSNAAKLRRA